MIEHIKQSMSLDLNNSSYKVVKTTSGNSNCRFLVITITKDEEDYTIPDGVEAVVRGHRSDNKSFFEETTISENEIIIELNNNIIGKGGVSECELAFYYNKGKDDEQLLISMPFKIQAPESPFDEKAVVESKQFSALDKAIITVQGLIENVSELKEETTAIINSWNDYYKPQMDQAIVNEQQRVENENSRISAENARVDAESIRVSNEDSRVEAENNRVSVENARVAAENARVSAENSRVSAESDRVSAENIRVSSEEERVSAENNRVSAEDARVAAESNRVSAENIRSSSETERNNAETERISAENERVSAENTRIENEEARIDAENARKEAETNRNTEESKRVSAETNRANAEAIRNSSEESRVNAENDRVEAENIRVQNETNRIAAESDRVSAETNRVTAENIRVANENERIENEAKRIEAEKSRETNTAEAIKNSEAATKKAEDAASGVIAALEGTIATVDHVGLSKPDGDTITIDRDGTLHSSAKGIEITIEEYNALSEEEKNNGSVYYITDIDSLEDGGVTVKEIIDNAIDDIEIGGRNLLLNSNFELPGKPNWFDSNLSGRAYITDEGRNGGYCAKQIGEFNKDSNLFNLIDSKVHKIKIKANDIFTFSGWYKVQDYVPGTKNNYVRPYVSYFNSNDAWISESLILDISPDATDWTYVEASFKVPNISTIDNMLFALHARDYTGIIWWDDIKLEKGNKATDWTPAPEDIEKAIQTVDNKLTTNLLKPTLETTTKNGVTCTNNGDGTYTLNGTASADSAAEFMLYSSSNLVELNKEFRLTGCPNNTVARLFVADWGNPWTVYGKDEGNGSNFRITTSSPNKRVVINVPKGTTVDNIVFKPMITTNLNATYDDFVPYTGSTGQINSDVAEVRNDLNEKIGDYHLDFGYKSKSEVAIVTNKTITVSSNTFTWRTENDKTFMCTSNNPFSDVWNPTDAPDICGFVFKVVWDGTEYILLGHKRDRSYAQGVDEQYLFGNTSLLGYSNSSDDDTIPFLVVVGRWGNTNDDQKSLKILTNDTSSASHTISISRIEIDYKKIPPYYLDTLHRSGKLIHKGTGQGGIVIGMATDASGEGSVAEGECTIASGYASHAEGEKNTASGEVSHAEGEKSTASGGASHAEGLKTTASGLESHAEGFMTTASGNSSHAEGRKNIASGKGSHAEGLFTKASSNYQHVQGKYNIEDAENKYAHIVGNGTGEEARSNAHTLDWEGNAMYAGDVEAQKQVKGESININNKIDLLYDSSTESLNFVFK